MYSHAGFHIYHQRCCWHRHLRVFRNHYSNVIMGTIASQITNLTIVYSTVHLGADQRKYQSSTSLAFVRGIRRGPVNSPHKWPVSRKMFPFNDVIMMNVGRIVLHDEPKLNLYHKTIEMNAPETAREGEVPDILHQYQACLMFYFCCWFVTYNIGRTIS